MISQNGNGELDLENNNKESYQEEDDCKTKKGVKIIPKHENKESTSDANIVQDIPIGMPVEKSELKKHKNKANELIPENQSTTSQADAKDGEDD